LQGRPIYDIFNEIMKALFLASDVNQIGGIQKYNRDFLSALLKSGVKTTLIERYKGGLGPKISFLFRFFAALAKERPDIVFCSHLYFSPMCLFAKKFFKTPYVLALYGIEAFEIKGFLRRRGVRGAEKIITITEYIKGFIVKQFPEFRDNIFIHPVAVDESLFRVGKKKKELLEKFGIGDKKVILTLSRLLSEKHKGQDRVLKALPRVLEKVPDAIYLIVGRGEDYRVNQFMEEHPEMKKHVIFAGPIADEEKNDYYNLADVFVLPSKFEGFAIVFIEALACGIPIIASDGYGCRESLLDGEIGILIDPDDVRAIADAIVAVLQKKAPPIFSDRERLRARSLEVYGIEAWNERVKQLANSIFK
jgi:phosphatidyl-myo-inositol dimannoside synthase